MFSRLPGSDVPWLLPRSCAGLWPYEPRWRTIYRHPSVQERYERIFRYFVIPDFQDRSIQVAVELVKRMANEMLENREVKHFEVVPICVKDRRSIPHRMCAEKGCDVCSGLGILLVPDRKSDVAMVGWEAICRVA